MESLSSDPSPPERWQSNSSSEMPQPSGGSYRYDAFISYRRVDGSRTAGWLRRKLLRYRLPKPLREQGEKKRLEIFHDIAYEQAGPDFYDEAIRPALLSSRYLVVVVTPQTLVPRPGGEPNWVEREIRDFLDPLPPSDASSEDPEDGRKRRESRARRVLVALASGASPAPLPGGLQTLLPRLDYADLRELPRSPVLSWSRRNRLQGEFLKVVAPLWGIRQEDMPVLRREESRRQQQRLAAVAFTALALLSLVSFLLVWAVRNLDQARLELVQNHLMQGRTLLVERPAQARLYFAKAVEIAESPPLLARRLEAEAALGRAWLGEVSRQPAPIILWHPGEPRSAFFDRSGRQLLTASYDGTVCLWDVRTGRQITVLRTDRKNLEFAIPALGGSRIVTVSRSGDQDEVLLWNPQEGQRPTRLPFPVSSVDPIDYTPEKDLLRILDPDHRLHAWDADAGRLLGPPIPLLREETWFTVSPQRDHLLTTSSGALQLWNLRTGKRMGDRKPYGGLPTEVGWSGNGTRFVSPGVGGDLRVWDSATGEPVSPVLRLPGPSSYSRLSRDGSKLLTSWDAREAGHGYAVVLLEVTTGRLLAGPMWAGNLQGSPEFTPDERLLVTFTSTEIRLWDAATGAPLGAPMTQSDAITTALLSPEGSLLATVAIGGTVRVWKLSEQVLARPPMEHSGTIDEVLFSRDGRRIVTVSWDGTVRIWPVFLPEIPRQRLTIDGKPAHGGGVLSAAFHPTVPEVATAGQDGIVRIWSSDTGALLHEVPHQSGSSVLHVEYSPDGVFFATASADGKARLFRRNGSLIRSHGHGGKSVRAAVFSPHGDLIVTAGDDKVARVWSTADGRSVCAYSDHQETIDHVAFSPDGTLAATSSRDGTARVWASRSCKTVSVPLKAAAQVFMATFSPDGKRLATAVGGGSAQVWDVRTGAPVTPPFTNRNGIRQVSFSPDGKLLIAAGLDGNTQIWEIDSARPVGKPETHLGAVWTASFSPDGARALTAGFDLKARIWDTRTGDAIGPPLPSEAALMVGLFSPDGKKVLTGDILGNVLLWSATPSSEPAGKLLLQAETSSALHFDEATSTIRQLSEAEWKVRKERIRRAR